MFAARRRARSAGTGQTENLNRDMAEVVDRAIISAREKVVSSNLGRLIKLAPRCLVAATVTRAEIAGGPDSRFLSVAAMHFPWLGFDQAPGHPANVPCWLHVRPFRTLLSPGEASKGPDWW